MRLPTLFQRTPPPDLDAITQRAAQAAVAEYRAEQERAAEQGRAMLQEAQEIARAQGSGMMGMPGFAGNGRGSLYPGVYARDHPYHWSQPGWATWRPGALLSVDTLRQFSQRYDVLRAMINYLKDHVKTVPMQVVARNEKDDSEETKARIKAAQAYFDHEGGLGGPGEERWEFEGKLIEDLLTLGVGTVYLPTTRGGDLMDAVTLDAATIRPRVDMLGWPGPGEAWYDQIVDGLPHRSFTREQLYWKGLYPRNDNPYPDSPVEYLALTVLAAMSADTWNRSWLTTGTEPGRMVSLPADMTPANAQVWIEYFLARYEGDIEARQRLGFMPGGATQPQNPSRRDHDFQEFMLWLAKRCSAIIGVQLAAIGLSEGKEYAVTQEKSVDQTGDVGVTKVLVYLTSLYCYLLERLGYPDLCAQFVTAQEEGAAERAERVAKLVGAGIWSPNRALKELGDDADPSEGASVLWMPTTMQPMELAMNPPEPVAPGSGAAGNGSSNGARKPSRETESRRAAFDAWELKVLRRLEEGRAADCAPAYEPLAAAVLDAEEVADVRERLVQAEDADAARQVFQRAREMGLPRFNETWPEAQRRQIAERWRVRRLAAEREG